MTYKEFFMQFNTLEEIEKEAKREIKLAIMLNPDRVKMIEKAIEEVVAEKFNIGDEDDIPAPSVFEHKGYVLEQSNYNNHYMIFKDGNWVCHCQCTEKLDRKKAEEAIDFYLDLTYGRLAKETERIIKEQNDG